MTEPPPSAIECEGAPRDVGLDQGFALRGVLRAEWRRTPSLARLRARLGRGDDRVARDLWRHFPHQAESLEGSALGARVPCAWLATRLARSGGVLAAGVFAEEGGDARLACALPPQARLRRSRHEGRFRSLDLTLPWLTSALAGVNERGLAVALGPLGSASAESDCAAPASLLVQDCLQRFECVDAALEWCAGRPAGARARLLFADARGELAGVDIDGSARRTLRPSEGLLVADGTREAELSKALRERRPGDARDLALALSSAARSRAASAVLEARAGRLLVVDGDARRVDEFRV